MGVAAVVTLVVTVDLLSRGWLEWMDLRVSEVVSSWGIEHGTPWYWPVYAVTQLGGRGFILVVLAVLVGYIGWTRRTLLPLLRGLLPPARRSGLLPRRAGRAGRLLGLAPPDPAPAAAGAARPRAADGGGLRVQVRDRPHGAGLPRLVLPPGRRVLPLRPRRQRRPHVGRRALAGGRVRAADTRAAVPVVAVRPRTRRGGGGDGVPGLPLGHRRGRGGGRGHLAPGRGACTRCGRSVTLRSCPSRPAVRLAARARACSCPAARWSPPCSSVPSPPHWLRRPSPRSTPRSRRRSAG